MKKLEDGDRIVIDTIDNSKFTNTFHATVTDLDTCKLVWVATNEQRVDEFSKYGEFLEFRRDSGIYDEVAFLIIDPTHSRGTAAWFLYRISRQWFTEQPRENYPSRNITSWERLRVTIRLEE